MKRYSTHNNHSYSKQNMIEAVLNTIKLCAIDHKKTYVEILDTNKECFSTIKFNMTINSIKNNIDLIINPVIFNYSEKIYGTPNIIISKRLLLILFEDKKYGFNKIYNKEFIKSKYIILSIKNNNTKIKLNKKDKINKKIYSSYLHIVDGITKTDNCIGRINNNNCIITNPELITDNDTIQLNKGAEYKRS